MSTDPTCKRESMWKAVWLVTSATATTMDKVCENGGIIHFRSEQALCFTQEPKARCLPGMLQQCLSNSEKTFTGLS